MLIVVVMPFATGLVFGVAGYLAYALATRPRSAALLRRRLVVEAIFWFRDVPRGLLRHIPSMIRTANGPRHFVFGVRCCWKILKLRRALMLWEVRA